MGLLSAADAEQVRKLFDGIARDVGIRLYTQRLNCDGCLDTERIVTELASLSGRIRLEKLNFLTDTAQKESDDIAAVPAILVSDGSHNRARFYGTPSGYEFTTLLTAIVDAGSGKPEIEQATSYFLSSLDRDLLLKVFVTPTCPHCPRAAVTALRLAGASPRVRAEIIEANEFPEMSIRYSVQGVPRTVINDRLHLEGSLPEAVFVEALAAALPSIDSVEGSRDLMTFLEPDTE